MTIAVTLFDHWCSHHNTLDHAPNRSLRNNGCDGRGVHCPLVYRGHVSRQRYVRLFLNVLRQACEHLLVEFVPCLDHERLRMVDAAHIEAIHVLEDD